MNQTALMALSLIIQIAYLLVLLLDLWLKRRK